MHAKFRAVTVASTLFFLLIAVAGCTHQSPQINASRSAGNGTLELISWDGKRCEIPIVEGAVERQWQGYFPGCSFKEFVKFRFVNAPSAVTVKMYSFVNLGEGNETTFPSDCAGVNPRYWYRLSIKTVGAIKDGQLFDVDDMLATSLNGAVVANVRLLSKSTYQIAVHPIHEYMGCFVFEL